MTAVFERDPVVGGALDGLSLGPGFDIILLAGQSNMSGIRALPLDTARLDVTDGRIWQYGVAATLPGQIRIASAPLDMPDASPGVSPGQELARWYLQRAAPTRRVVLVGAAFTGTGFVNEPDTYSWHEDITGLYSLRENAVAKAQETIAAAGDNARLAAIGWVQGEEDGEHLMDGATYQEHLDGLIVYFRDELGADVPFVIGQMVPDYLATDTREEINAVHIDTPRRHHLCGFAYGPTGLTVGDGKHYSPAGSRRLGRAMADALILARANVSGNPLPPTDVTLEQSGDDLLITWDRPPCRFTNFPVRYREAGEASWTTLARAPSIDNRASIAITLGETYEVQVATVNETGTSVYSATETITTVVAPGQPTGLTAGTPAASSVLLSWNDPAGAPVSESILQVKLAASLTWTDWATVTGTSTTIRGLVPNSDYEARVVASNPAGRGTPSAAVSLTTDDVAVLLTEVPVSAHVAFGTRRLRAAYASACLRVRLGIDDSEIDIPFDAGGNLDVTALLVACAGGSAWVAKLYDQSGAGGTRDLAQANPDAQPRLVKDGVLETLNGRPALWFDGIDDVLIATVAGGYPQIWAVNGATSWLAVVDGDTPNNSTVWCEGSTADSSRYQSHYVISRKLTQQYRATSAGVLITGSTTAGAQTAMNGEPHVLSEVDTGASVTAIDNFVDGAVNETDRAPSSHPAVTMTHLAMGAFVRTTTTNFFAGHINELVLFQSALSDANRQAAETNLADYHAVD